MKTLAVYFLACCVAFLCGRASATGFDTVRLDLPSRGYAESLAGCTTYVEPDSMLVFYCDSQAREPLAVTEPYGDTFVVGAFGISFELQDADGLCRATGYSETHDADGTVGLVSYAFLCDPDWILVTGFE